MTKQEYRRRRALGKSFIKDCYTQLPTPYDNRSTRKIKL